MFLIISLSKFLRYWRFILYFTESTEVRVPHFFWPHPFYWLAISSGFSSEKLLSPWKINPWYFSIQDRQQRRCCHFQKEFFLLKKNQKCSRTTKYKKYLRINLFIINILYIFSSEKIIAQSADYYQEDRKRTVFRIWIGTRLCRITVLLSNLSFNSLDLSSMIPL